MDIEAEVSSMPPPVRKSAPAIPRRSSLRRNSFSARSALPPKVGSKKRKPRPASIVMAANSRLQSDTLSELASPFASMDTRRKQLATPPPPPSPPPLPPVNSVSPVLPVGDSKRKGLRHFAVRVCKKVEEKGQTTYNEVADELVAEERNYRVQAITSANSSAQHSELSLLSDPSSPLVDEKNIRRRVYDSLNVLMAMQIIGKNKKLISWQGLAAVRCVPPIATDIERLKKEVEMKQHTLVRKAAELKRLREQDDLMRSLIRRRQAEEALMVGAIDDPSSPQLPMFARVVGENQRVSLPFLIIKTSSDAEIKLTMDEDHKEASFHFSSPFVLFDYSEILRRLSSLSELSLPHDFDVT